MSYTARWRALRVNPARIDVGAAERDAVLFVEAFLQARVRELQVYPPPPPNSTYVRTGELGRGWHVSVQRTLSAVNGYITNVATDRTSGRRYMTYVQGPWQTPQHRSTGWRTVGDARAASQALYRAGLQAIYSKYIRKGP